MRSERERLLDILEAIERIEKYTQGGESAFEADELVQTWVVDHIEVIGEACRSLPAEFQALRKCSMGGYYCDAKHPRSPLFWD